jgi:hypothetical protein
MADTPKRNTKADLRKTAEIYVDAIRKGEIDRDRAIEELTEQFKAAVWWEHDRIAKWLYARARSHGDGPTAALRKALAHYLKKVRAR